MPDTKARAGPVVRATAAVVGRMLDAGELGDPLPPERVLANWLNVNRLTLRWAIDRLIALGRLTRQQGSGVRLVAGAALNQSLNSSSRGVSPASPVGASGGHGPTLALIVDDPPQQVGGWAWRAAMLIVRNAQQRGDRVVTLTASDCLNPSSSQSTAAGFLLGRSRQARRGAVVLSDRIDSATFERLRSLPLPIIGLGRCQARNLWNVIDVDWSPALHEAMNEIPTIADASALILTSDDATALDRQRWCETLVCGLVARGYSADRLTVVPTSGGEGGAYLIVRRHLRQSESLPAVVFSDDDLFAAGACRALAHHGTGGAGVFVLGCGGTRVSQYVRPRFPTLSPPISQITRLADDWLMDADAANRRFALQLLPARYIRRNTSALMTGH